MILELIHNVALLVALAVGLQMLARRMVRRPLLYRLAAGVLFGAVCMAGMMTPMQFAPGVIYDARSVILSLAGLFGGPVVVAIAAVLAGAYRLHLGGGGALVGVLVIVEAAALGVTLHYLRRRSERWVSWPALLLFGVLVHAGMLALQLLLPEGKGWQVLREVGPTVILTYPLGFLLVAQVFLEGQRRREAEGKAWKSESLRQAMVSCSPLALYSVDMEGNVLTWNESAERLFGWRADEVLGRPLPIVPDGKEGEFAELRDRVKSGESFTGVELVRRRKDGSRFEASLAVAPLRDETGRMAGIVGTMEDITSRKESEEALREQEQRYRSLFEDNHAVMMLIDPDSGLIVDANPAAVRFYGWSRDEMIGMSVSDINTMSTSEIRQEMAKAQESRRNHFEFRHRLADGSLRDVEVFSGPIQVEQRDLLYSIVHDVTEQAEARQRLEDREEFLQTIVQTSADGFWVVDGQGRIVEVNDAYCAMSGYQRDELIGLSISDIDAREDAAAIRAHIQHLIERGSELFETEHRRKDGSIFPLEISVTYIGHGDGSFVCFCRNLTEKQLAANRLRESETRLRRAQQVAQIGDWEFHLNNGTIVTSEEARRIYGIDEGDWTISEVQQLSLPEYRPVLDKSMKDLVEQGLPYDVEFQIRRPDGKIVDIHSVAEYKPAENIVFGVIQDITRRRSDQRRLEWNLKRNALLSDTAARLLESEDPQRLVEDICLRVMELIDCDVFFNFLQDLQKGQLHLNACAGIPEEEVRKLEWLEHGVAVCGCVARDCQPMVCEDIQDQDSELTELVKSYGVEAYCCHPLMVQGRMIGTLSFGRKSSCRFGPEELDLMASVTNLVAMAMNRIETERKLRENEAHLRAIFDSAQDAIYLKDTDLRYTHCNRAMAGLFGQDRDQVIGRTDADLFPGEDVTEIAATDRRVLTGRPVRGTFTRTIAGQQRAIDTSKSPVFDADGRVVGLCGVSRDITEDISLREQMRQAQKMEAVGRLAGGVAHDFNNMLQTILGYSDMLLAEAGENHPFRKDIEEIRKAGARSADLTRQLLAFARKQTIAPMVLDINAAVTDMLKMLQRLIGEDIDLLWKPCQDKCLVKIDPAQVDQVLANLVVNSRDAIAGNGRITIETACVEFDEDYCRTHEGFRPGRYQVLAVSDDGAGMDRKTLGQAFEPFFTTKGKDKGTGLGLATVYGIIKQNDGFINIYSEPGQGTTVRMYLPAVTDGSESPRRDAGSVELPTGMETLLLVEDEPALLKLSRQVLEGLGYTVLPASGPGDALTLATDGSYQFDLLITDVIMPQMSGRALHEKLSEQCPGLRCLYMSGYTENVIAHHGVLEEGVHFLQKPFSTADLARKLREILDDGTGVQERDAHG